MLESPLHVETDAVPGSQDEPLVDDGAAASLVILRVVPRSDHSITLPPNFPLSLPRNRPDEGHERPRLGLPAVDDARGLVVLLLERGGRGSDLGRGVGVFLSATALAYANNKEILFLRQPLKSATWAGRVVLELDGLPAHARFRELEEPS